MAYCERCHQCFNSERALTQHEENSSHHHVCYTCHKDYTCRSDITAHWGRSSAHSYCVDCDQHFDSGGLLNDHYEDAHWFCSPCFQSSNNLQIHLRSTIHSPRKYKCPGAHCEKSFVSDSALVMHCESGSCRSGVTRHAINRVIFAIDQGRTLTDGCDDEFRTLSGLFQHVESGRCEVKRFRRQLTGVVDSFRDQLRYMSFEG
ncbi:hypothetical protein K474DRAFT_1685632 [Panus rudis PR-1116 ss-1]|nr:hypothetical protein K474DRAFT_1685632 [Panus rudis PR-1116 ss-1]